MFVFVSCLELSPILGGADVRQTSGSVLRDADCPHTCDTHIPQQKPFPKQMPSGIACLWVPVYREEREPVRFAPVRSQEFVH